MPAPTAATLTVDPQPRFALSPYLFMQFMEPLGTTDSSVEAAWNHEQHDWRDDVVAATRALAPSLIRWPGGILTSYYRWREGIGPRAARVPMLNLVWGGMESNQVGTHEFIDFCRRVGAEPLLAVNFESDGVRRWSHPANGQTRSAGPEEAAAWVDYCNNPAHAERIGNGAREPFNVRLWQIGNETSYPPDGAFTAETAAQRTVAFAEAMRRADPTIALIGWGDSGWATTMLDIAGRHLQYIAFHHHFNSGLDDSPLQFNAWRRDPAETWRHLMHAVHSTDAKIQTMRQAVAGHNVALALTESHFGLQGRNRCDVLATWAAGVAYGRILNAHARHGDLLKIATLADFCGNRWMTNAILIPTPRGRKAYLMPVATVMALYRQTRGEQAVAVTTSPDGLDVAASRTGDTVFVHVVNTQRTQAVRARVQVMGRRLDAGRAFVIAADDPFNEVDHGTPERFAPQERAFAADSAWEFPAASVTALVLPLARA